MMMALADAESTSSSSSSRRVSPLDAFENIRAKSNPPRRLKKKRQSLPDLLLDNQAVERMNIPSISSPIDGHYQFLVDSPFQQFSSTNSRPHSGESAKRSARSSATSSSSARRMMRTEQNRHSKRLSTDWQEDSSQSRKQFETVKPRQKRKPVPYLDLPTTPITPSFNAMGSEDGSSTRGSASIASSAIMANPSADCSWRRQRSIPITDHLLSPALSYDGISADEMTTSTSTYDLSMTSEADTPGPITPATPAWKPKELALLKKSLDSSYESISRVDRDRHLIGLGFRSPSPLFTTEDTNRSGRASRLLIKDILPIANSTLSKLPSSPNNIGNGKRELRFASSSVPPHGSSRRRSLSQSSSPPSHQYSGSSQPNESEDSYPSSNPPPEDINSSADPAVSFNTKIFSSFPPVDLSSAGGREVQREEAHSSDFAPMPPSPTAPFMIRNLAVCSAPGPPSSDAHSVHPRKEMTPTSPPQIVTVGEEVSEVTPKPIAGRPQAGQIDVKSALPSITALSEKLKAAQSVYDRPLPPLPRPKLSIVPDVPSFGYSGPVDNKAAESFPVSSPMFGYEEYSSSPLREEGEPMSRWSSGSDSEDDKSMAKKKMGKQQRKNSGSNSGFSSKKNSFSGSTTTSNPRKPSFFAGLGLRKKSVPNLSSQFSQNSDSPAPGKLDGLAEFPFPTNSPASHSQYSFTSSSRRESGSQLALPPLPSNYNDNLVRSSPRNSQSRLANAFSSRMSQGSHRKLTVKASDASIRTTASSHGMMAGAWRSYSTSASQSPALERSASSVWGDYDNVQGLGIQVPGEEGGNTDEALLRETYESLQRSLQSGKPNENSGSKSGQETSQGDQLDYQSLKQPVYDDEHEKMTSKSLNRPPSPVSETQSPFSAFTLSDGTPRGLYSSLDSPQMVEPKNKAARTVEYSIEDASAVGQLIMGQTTDRLTPQAADFPIPPLRVKRKGNKVKASIRPRYNSMTDVGMQWKEENPDLAFGAARGAILMITELSGDKTSGGRIVKTSPFSDGSDSGTDDYGSSDGAGGQGSGDASRQGHGKGDDERDDEKETRRKPFYAADEDLESDTESDDSYGGSDEEGEPSAESRARREASCSSDDVPLGQQVQDPNELQRQLRKMAPKTKRSNQVSHGAQVEVPSNKLHFVLDANDLTARLLKVQLAREAVAATASRSTTAATTTTSKPSPSLLGEGSSRADSTTISRNRSTTSRRDQMKIVIPPMPAPSMIAIQSRENHNSNDQPLSKMLQVVSTIANSSTPSSPIFKQPTSSNTAHTDSSEASMKTALEALPSSQGQQLRSDDYRSAVIADFANTIKARSRSRSLAQPFTPPTDHIKRPPLPVSSRTNGMPLTSKATVAASSPTTTEFKSSPMDAGNSSLSIASVSGNRSASLGLKSSSSSADEQDNISSRAKRVMMPPLLAMVQHRIFLLNKQRFGIAEVAMNAKVRDVVDSIMEREPMPTDSRAGGWVLYDVCADLGIERPMREYELISEVIALRSNAQSDYFVMKKTELAPYLSLKNIPNSSAAVAGWIYYQDNHRNKWNKRWLELRENCLYIAKTEKGKDESLLCSLSSFDLYLTDSNRFKAPKLHSFALRSQDSINMFESPEVDYAHYFATSDAGAARHWITAILNARTFVLRMEKSHLFRVNATSTSVAAFSSSALPSARQQRTPLPVAGTTAASAAAAPLSNSPAPATAALNGSSSKPLLTFQQAAFAKGSLMGDRFASNDVNNENIAIVAASTSTNQSRDVAIERKRREEVQMAERKGRKEGRPLIGIIPDATRFNNRL